VAITIPIITDFNGRGTDKAIKQFQRMEGAGAKAGFAIRKAAIPAGIALAAVGAAILGGTKAALEDQKSSEQLARTIGKVTNATKSQVSGLEAYITKTERATNVTDMELRPALALLSTATGSLEKGQQGLALALDVAAGTGKPLAQVSEALSKAYAGNLRGLNALDPRMKELVKNGATADEAMQVLSKTFKGDAAAATKTAEGRMKGMSIAISEAQESIGHALLPAIEKVLPVILKFTRYLQDNPKVVMIAGAAIAGLAVGILALNVAMMILSANPVALIIAAVVVAVVALTVGIITLYKKSETFRKIVEGAWEGVQKAVEIVVNYLKGPVMAAWDTIKGVLEVIKGLISGDFSRVWEGLKTTIGGVLDGIKTTILAFPLLIGNAVLDIGKTIVSKIAEGVADLATKVWDKITGLPQALKNLAVGWVEGLTELGGRIITYMVKGVTGLGEKVWDHISGIPEFLKKKISGIAAAMKELGGEIVGFVVTGIENAASAVAGGLKTMLNGVISVVNKAINAVNKIRSGVNKISPFPDIPPIPNIDPIKLAKGGIVTQPTLALIGEAGPEAVIPLSGRNAGMGMGMTINVQAGLVANPDQIGQQIIEAIQKAQRRSGPVFAPA
jgi:phage-related protein